MQNLLKHIGNKHAPLRSIRVRGSQPPWMTDEIRQTMKSRDAMKRKAVKTKSDNVWNAFKRLRNTVTRLIDVAKREYFNNLLTDNTKDTSNIKKLLPNKKKVSLQEITLDNISYTSNQGMATILNKFFTTVAERLKSTQPNQVDLSNVSNAPILVSVKNFEFKDISVDFVRKELSSSKVNKSSGLEYIHIRFLKTGADVIAAPLTYILNLSLRSAIILWSWKSGAVTPLHKDGSVSDPNNFRPISVLPVVMKISERAVHSQIYQHLSSNKLLSSHQLGFRPQATLRQLASSMYLISS